MLTCAFLKKRNIDYGNIIEFIRNPRIYPGNPSGPRQIFESNLDKLLAKHRKQIQEAGLSIDYVYNTIVKQITKRKRGR